MNPEQFRKWADDFGRHFPSIAKWLNGLGNDGRDNQLEFWANVLSDVSYRDAITATQKMYGEEGEFDAYGNWKGGEFAPIGTKDSQRERTPSHVRSLARKIKMRRDEAGRPPNLTEPEFRTRKVKQHNGVLDKVEHLVKSTGLTISDAVEHIFGPVDPEDEPRFACLICSDSGRVSVWRTPFCFQAWKAGVLDDRRNQRIWTRPCSCDRGDRYMPIARTEGLRKNTDPNGSVEWYRYQPHRDCLDGPLGDFIEWCKERETLENFVNAQRFEAGNPEQTKELEF